MIESSPDAVPSFPGTHPMNVSINDILDALRSQALEHAIKRVLDTGVAEFTCA